MVDASEGRLAEVMVDASEGRFEGVDVVDASEGQTETGKDEVDGSDVAEGEEGPVGVTTSGSTERAGGVKVCADTDNGS